MAQVRAVRRPYTSRRGRVNDAAHAETAETAVESSVSLPPPSTPPQSNVPGVTTIELPPLLESEVQLLPEASDEEREAPGIGEEMQGVEATPDGTEHELTVTEVEADAQAEAARAAEPESTVDYSSWTVQRLVAELKRRELPSSGAKPELIVRLLESDVDAGA